MSGFYIYTGKLGGGKSLCAVGRIKEHLQKGLKVATNLDLKLHKMFPAKTRAINVIRVPDKPSVTDLNVLGVGNSTYDEELNGLLVLDECGTWFNSRNWNDKGRKDVNDWFLHARKLGWTVILIIQDISILDSQARATLAEHTAFCRRTDRVQVPFIGTLFKAISGYRLALPKLHTARVVYGTSEKDLLADRHTYTGKSLYPCYDTKQLFLEDYAHGVHSVLTPWHLKGRYSVKHNKEFYMRITKIYFKRLRSPAAMTLGSIVGVCATLFFFTSYSQNIEAGELVSSNLATTEIIESPNTIATFEEAEDQYASSLINSLDTYDGYLKNARKAIYLFTDNRGRLVKSNDFESIGITIITRRNSITLVHADTYKTLMPSVEGINKDMVASSK
jgi:hypothetical protein